MRKTEFKKRRKKLLAKMRENSIAIIPNRPSCDVCSQHQSNYKYFPDNDFYYLTGIEIPKAFAVFVKEKKHRGHFILFVPPRDSETEKWQGKMIGPKEALKYFGADETFCIQKLTETCIDLLSNKKQLYYPYGRYESIDKQMANLIKQTRSFHKSHNAAPTSIEDIAPLLYEMRLIKTEPEIKMIEKAIEITSNALLKTIQYCKIGMYAYQLDSILSKEYEVHRVGKAFPTIIAGGNNACTLHYEKNDDVLKNNELVLIDTGSAFDHYASDITRTFPAGNQFTEPQKLLYNIVLKAQLEAISEIRPGRTFEQLHLAAAHIITEGLKKLGILKGRLNYLIKEKAYKPFFPHSIGHFMGLAVHDVDGRKIGEKWRTLKAGMVLTIEPGIYIPAGVKHVEKKWRGIGIRIEDDVLVIHKGHRVLSTIPKTIEEIEKIKNLS